MPKTPDDELWEELVMVIEQLALGETERFQIKLALEKGYSKEEAIELAHRLRAAK